MFLPRFVGRISRSARNVPRASNWTSRFLTRSFTTTASPSTTTSTSVSDVTLQSWLQSASSGDVSAANCLGQYYYQQKSYKQALIWLTQASEGGHVSATTQLAALYLLGYGMSNRDPQRAMQLYTRAAEQGNAHAQYAAGTWLIRTGTSSKKQDDVQKGVEWIHKAAEQDHAAALEQYGTILLHGHHNTTKDTHQALTHLRRAADDHGHIKAIQTMGIAYAKGLYGLPIDLSTASSYLHRASAHTECREAQACLGELYLRERLPRDASHPDTPDWSRRVAISYLRRSMNAGDADAQSLMSLIYYHGWGVPRDLQQAVTWGAPAGDNGRMDAIFIMGIICLEAGGEKSHDKAMRWLEQLPSLARKANLAAANNNDNNNTSTPIPFDSAALSLLTALPFTPNICLTWLPTYQKTHNQPWLGSFPDLLRIQPPPT